MELHKLYPDENLFKVLCPLGVANVMFSFQESDPFPFLKGFGILPFMIYDYFSSYMA